MKVERRVYYPGPGRLVLVLLVAGVLTAMSAHAVGDTSAPTVIHIVGYIGTPFFGLASFYVLYRLAWKTPSVVIDELGVHYSAGIFGVGLIPWSNIADAKVYSIQNQKMVGIALRDNASFIAGLRGSRRGITKMNVALGFPPVSIPQTTLSVSAEELAGDIMNALRS